MNKNKLISIILSACVLSTNSNFVVMAGTTNNSENIKSEGTAFVSGSDGIISDYTNILSEANLIFRASNVGNSQIDLSDYISECRNLTSATIIVRFRVPEELENGERSLIKFKNSTSESENSFSVFFEKQSSTQGRFGYHCMINGTESPTGQRFSNVDYNTSGYNTLVVSITEGEGYATSLNNVKNYTSTAGNSIKFLNSISGLDTITTGDIDIAYIEVYNQKINEVEASRIANVNINDDNGLEKIDNIEVVKFNSEHKVESVTESTKEGNAYFAVDRNFATHWHTDWNGGSPSPAGPHYITLDLGNEEVIDILEYLPRQDSGDGSGNGTITGYKVYASNSIPDGDITIENGEVTDGGFIKIGEGSLENSSSIKLIDVKDIKARYVTLVSTSGHNGFASASEIYVNRGIELPSPSVSTVNVKEDTITNSSVTLNWSIDEENDEYIDKYVLYFNDNVREPIELSKETLEYTIDNLEGNREYTFEIAAINTQNIESERKSITVKTLKNELGIEGFDVQGSMETGTTHTIIPIGVGGAGVTYTYSVYNTSTGWNTLESNTTKSKLDWTPSIIGSHLVRVEVKDINGKVVRSDKWINFDNSSLTIEDMIISENIQAGTEVIINPVGDKTDSTKYTLEVYNTIEGWKTIASDVVSDEDGNVNLHWTPNKAGANLVRITAKDDTNKIIRYEEWISVKNDALSLTGIETDGSLQVGEGETIKVNGSINSSLIDSTKYKLEVYNTTQGWKTISDYESMPFGNVEFNWIPEIYGKNLIRVSTTDNSGKIVRYDEWVDVKYDAFTLKDIAIYNNDYSDISSDLEIGEEYIVVGLDEYGNWAKYGQYQDGKYDYSWEVYNTTYGWQEFGDYNGDQALTTYRDDVKFVEGSNLIRLTIKSKSGKVVKAEKWLTIKNSALTLTGIETDGDLQVGNEETIKVNGTINSKLMDSTKYKLEVYNTTQGWKTISDYESMPFGDVKFKWSPETCGKNLIRVTVTDRSGKVARYDEWVDVTLDVISPETNPAEDNWLSEEIARQVGKEDYTTLTQEDFDSITRIDISNEGLTEVPSQIKYVKNLKNLYLDSNSISELPSELFQLSQLEILYLGDNNISIIPNEIGNLTNLKKLILFENPLTELPEEIGNLSDLSYLHLLYTGLENLPENIGQLSNLKELHLAGCEISGLPSSIGNLNNLQVLDLGNNNITNVVPEIGNLTSLKKLHLGGNNISDLPESMGNLVNLEKLYLSDNVGIKNLPESFKNLSKLTYLELLLTGITSINGISQEIRDVIGDENIKINFWDGISPWSLKSKTLSKNMHVITF